MRLRDFAQKRLGNLRGMSGMLDKVDVVNVTGRMELRHKQGIHVPEFGLDERPAHLLKSHTDQLRLHRIKEFPVRMLFAYRDSRCTEIDGVFSESLGSPASVLQQLRTELRDLLRAALLCEMLDRHDAGRCDLKWTGHPFVDSKRLFGIAPLDGIIKNDLPISLGKGLKLSRAFMKLLEQSSETLGGRTGAPGRLDAAPLHDQESPFFFQPADGLAHIRRVEIVLRV